MAWRRFPHSHYNALGEMVLHPQFERYVTSNRTELARNVQWATSDMTDEARSILIRQPFKARFYRVAGYVDAFAISVIFEKYKGELRARLMRQLLVVSSNQETVRDGHGLMGFTSRMLVFVHGKVEVRHSLYHANSWLPLEAMKEYSDPLGIQRRLEETAELDPQPDEVEEVTGDFSPEDLDAFRNL